MSHDTSPATHAKGWAARLAWPVGLGLSLFVALMVGPPWVSSWWAGLRGPARRAISIGFLKATLLGYGVVVALAIVSLAVTLWMVCRGDRKRQSRPLAAKVLLLSVSSLFAASLVQVGAWRYLVWAHRVPDMPPVPAISSSPNELTILVLGESSAEGQPYQGWLSIAHIVAWQMEQALPGTRVEVIMGATGGVPLAYAFPVMGRQERRPDIVLVYSGHNEFQALWGWSRVVNYYDDEQGVRTSDPLLDIVGNWSPLCRMIREAVETQRIDRPPTLDERRELGERPVCKPATRAGLRDLFENELEVLTRWCEAAGALPILVVPAGNDVGYDPGRSLMAPDTSRPDREAFLNEFRAAEALLESDPEKAERLMESFTRRQPLYAMAHYRLAQLQQARGRIEEARREYAMARDLDGLPMRCPSEFQDAYRAVASRHEVMLVDATTVLQGISPTGLLDDNVFHDGQHTTFRGYLAMAQTVMDGLWASGRFGLPRGPAPRVDPTACTDHFAMDSKAWSEVCVRTSVFWARLAALKIEAGPRLLRANRYDEAAKAIAAGASPDSLGIPGLGIHPVGLPPLPAP